MVNEKGYDITFVCVVCGEEHKLDEMHYYPIDNIRVCDKCFKDFRNKQFKGKK